MEAPQRHGRVNYLVFYCLARKWDGMERVLDICRERERDGGVYMMNCDGLANVYLVVDSFARRPRDWQILQLDEVPLLGIITGDAIPLRNPISALLLPGLETEEEF